MENEKPRSPASKPGQILWKANTPSREIARALIERFPPKPAETEGPPHPQAAADDIDRCPQCGSTEWIPIVYGHPTAETFEAMHRGEVAIGGCLIFPDRPDVECRRCSTPYRTKSGIGDEDDDWSDESGA